MWIGLILGVVYACVGFRGQGQPPRLAFTCGPFKDGMLVVGNHHIHHWMVVLPCAALFAVFRLWDLFAFCSVMTAQGLTYSDRCDTSVPAEASEAMENADNTEPLPCV